MENDNNKNKNSENSYKHILKYTGVFASVQMLGILVGVIRNKFTAIFLGPSGMGLLSLFNSTATFVSTSTNLGIPTSGVKVIADHRGEESILQVRTYSLLSALLGLLVCACLGPLLNLFTFSWGNHTLHYVLLAPTVFFTILAGGETAVLKALGQLRPLALQASLLAIFSLLVSVPIYWLFGQSGILAVLFLVAACQWALCLRFSCRVAPWHISFSRATLSSGLPLLRLGVSFVLAGMMSSGAEFLVRAFLNTQGDLEMVGLFNAGCTIVVVYAGMIFSVMESDYYPRLSAIVGARKDKVVQESRNLTVNRQLEMNVLLIGPIVSVMILCLPLIIRILYSSEFSGILRMTQIAAVGMLFKAVYLPIEYLPLSRGESRVFFFQESFCVILLIVGELAGYQAFSTCGRDMLPVALQGLAGDGLFGLGLGITMAYMVESLAVSLFCRLYYGYRMSRKALGYALYHFLILLLVSGMAIVDGTSVLYFVLAILLCLASLCFSLHFVRKSLKNQ